MGFSPMSTMVEGGSGMRWWLGDFGSHASIV